MAPGPQQPPHQPTNQHNRNARAVNKQNSAPGTVPGGRGGAGKKGSGCPPLPPAAAGTWLGMDRPQGNLASLCSLFTKAKRSKGSISLKSQTKPCLATFSAGAKGALITRPLTEDFSYPDGEPAGQPPSARLGSTLPGDRSSHPCSHLIRDRNHTSRNWMDKTKATSCQCFQVEDTRPARDKESHHQDRE